MTNNSDKLRVMWLLNHGIARRYDLEMLRLLGINEVFLPKSFPSDEGNLSADVDYNCDRLLTIPSDELDILNGANWYDQSDAAAWEIANRYFKVAVCANFPDQLDKITRHFRGGIILRCFGLPAEHTYSNILYERLGLAGVDRIRGLGDRFWFGQAYPHLHEIEHEFLRRRRCHLPLGLLDGTIKDEWQGTDPRILFVCPRIGTSPYYEGVFRSFLRDFKGLPYAVAGPQPVNVPDPNILGFADSQTCAEYMTRFRVMYYHSLEPNHIHYHPFEAIRAGMPLVFMAGSLLDRLGGGDLPGRCKTVKEARRKTQRLLSGDLQLAKRIRETQPRLLDQMRLEYGLPIWRRNFAKVLASTKHGAVTVQSTIRPRRKIAVILPLEYRGGTLRATKLIAAALHVGSRQAGEPADIVLAHLDISESYPNSEFHDLMPEISRRPYRWQTIDGETAERVLRYRGEEIGIDGMQFLVPNDGINNFLDCDLWLIISDRLSAPLLPVKPYALVVFDYIQRYQPLFPDGVDIPFLHAAKNASAVIVTTRFTGADAAQYAGADPRLIHVVPHIVPAFAEQPPPVKRSQNYFLWPTNLSVHKNHFNSLLALRYYYEELGGSLKCWITGVESQFLFGGKHPHLDRGKVLFESSPALRRNLTLMGELPDPIYRRSLAGARFLWHTALVDNGTFAAIEAAGVGVPILSSRYPAMQEMNDSHDLNIMWCDPNVPRQMAVQLKQMESEADALRHRLPSRESLEAKGLEYAAPAYWQVVRGCL
jgi:glycosyltransferase involved in cell wall biosynthesis